MLAAVPMLLTGCGGEEQTESSSAVSSEVSEPVSSTEVSSVPETVIDKDAWYLILVNATHKADESLAPDCETLPSGASVDKRIYKKAMKMIDDAAEDGYVINVTSAYRDYHWQTDLYNAEVQENLNKGMSESKAKDQAKTVVAEPGTSEHQTGLAMDVSTEGSTDLLETYEDTPEGKWLHKNCWKYGFILRYPKGKENITGIIYEPWHFRYVGEEAAKVITERGITLEEYLGEDDPIRPAGLTSSMTGDDSSDDTTEESSDSSSDVEDEASVEENDDSDSSSETIRDTSANPAVAMG